MLGMALLDFVLLTLLEIVVAAFRGKVTRRQLLASLVLSIGIGAAVTCVIAFLDAIALSITSVQPVIQCLYDQLKADTVDFAVRLLLFWLGASVSVSLPLLSLKLPRPQRHRGILYRSGQPPTDR
jgi:hypothetical protein